MIKNISDASTQFGLQLDTYIEHFELERTDIGNLLGTTARSIDKIIKGEKGIMLKTMETIAGFFGIAYYEMGNPNFSIPPFDLLPESTRAVITNRINSKKKDRDYETKFTRQLEYKVKVFLKEEHTSKEILDEMPDDIRTNDKYDPSRITDALRNGTLAHLVVIVGKRGQQYIFQLREYAPKEKILDIRSVSKKGKKQSKQ